ncbi:VOC family protein [Kribbella sp. NPDC051770]|uniref:VOC family protein n=1 Tax=Kribbella sp. NPDC051770 TaxID=3155413 RepID=UPI00342949F2
MEFISPVPMPGPDVVAPEVYRTIYPMPMFTIVPTDDLEASKDFWIRGLGFIDLFSVPGQVTHLRRWAFQDVLLVPGETPDKAPGLAVSFSCVLSQIDEIAEACEALTPARTIGPEVKLWNSLELTVLTPENTRVVMTAARVHDEASRENLRAIGIDVPD